MDIVYRLNMASNPLGSGGQTPPPPPGPNPPVPPELPKEGGEG